MASIVDPDPDGNPDLPGVREISPEAALWLVRREAILDYLNEQQPVDQRHNKRMAADLIRWVQEWCSADGQRAAERATWAVESLAESYDKRAMYGGALVWAQIRRALKTRAS